MNAWLEAVVRTMPEQYYWVPRRFKTRPDGETRPYRNKDQVAGRRPGWPSI